jgi:hypothetical protein
VSAIAPTKSAGEDRCCQTQTADLSSPLFPGSGASRRDQPPRAGPYFSGRSKGNCPECLGVQKTDLPGDILDSRADSFNSHYDVIFGHAKSFRPVTQFMLRIDVDTWRPSMLCQNVPLRFRHDGNFFVHNVGAVVRFPHHAATRPWPATSLAYLFIKRSQSGSLRPAIPGRAYPSLKARVALPPLKSYIDGMVSRGKWLLAAAMIALPSYTLAQVRGGVQSGVRGGDQRNNETRPSTRPVDCTRSFLQPLLAVNCCAGPDNHLELSALSASSTVTKCPRWSGAALHDQRCGLVETLPADCGSRPHDRWQCNPRC